MRSPARVRKRKLTGHEGLDFVRCRICGDHRRVISGRHLSKHDIDRKSYMEKYDLDPDELIAKDFRRIRSGRRGSQPNGRREWIAAVKKFYRQNGNALAISLQKQKPWLYNQARWLFGDWDKALLAVGFKPEKMRLRVFWNKEKVLQGILRLRAQGKPINARFVIKHDPSLFSGGQRQFGKWSVALRAAGIKPKA